MDPLQQLYMSYHNLLEEQTFVPEALPDDRIATHAALLQRLAETNNSGITVFDLCQRRHVFMSYNFPSLFGHDVRLVEEKDMEYFDSRIHPEDRLALLDSGIKALRFFYDLPSDRKSDYKLIREYRVLGRENAMIRVIEQQQVLELDAHGNLWLALSVMDLSPNQSLTEDVKWQVINFRQGLPVELASDRSNDALSPREVEVLQYIVEGFLSKEISDRLSISVHTVNTHRQRILKKLGANNSMEAARYANKLGLM